VAELLHVRAALLAADPAFYSTPAAIPGIPDQMTPSGVPTSLLEV
jgi:two-component system chemotaxis sensor kinase CheA